MKVKSGEGERSRDVLEGGYVMEWGRVMIHEKDGIGSVGGVVCGLDFPIFTPWNISRVE